MQPDRRTLADIWGVIGIGECLAGNLASQIPDNLLNASTLFKPQGRHGIDTSRSPGRNPDGDECDYGQQ
jgi:hypothetical protein